MNILFICTGNTCRSPMAEGFMKKFFSMNNHIGNVTSRGISVPSLSTVSKNAVLAAMDFDADISSHIPTQLSVSDMENADYIFCMTMNHRIYLVNIFPEYIDKILCMSEYSAQGDISDPYGGNLDTYKKTALQLYDTVHNIFKKIVDTNEYNI